MNKRYKVIRTLEPIRKLQPFWAFLVTGPGLPPQGTEFIGISEDAIDGILTTLESIYSAGLNDGVQPIAPRVVPITDKYPLASEEWE